MPGLERLLEQDFTGFCRNNKAVFAASRVAPTLHDRHQSATGSLAVGQRERGAAVGYCTGEIWSLSLPEGSHPNRSRQQRLPSPYFCLLMLHLAHEAKHAMLRRCAQKVRLHSLPRSSIARLACPCAPGRFQARSVRLSNRKSSMTVFLAVLHCLLLQVPVPVPMPAVPSAAARIPVIAVLPLAFATAFPPGIISLITIVSRLPVRVG
jgi:hypothetical protein